MFSREFFEVALIDQVNQMGAGRVTATIRLAIGTDYNVSRILRAEDTLVWLEVYPEAGNATDERRKRTDPITGDIQHDRIALPYQMIAFVTLTVADQQVSEDRGMGFHVTAKEKSKTQ